MCTGFTKDTHQYFIKASPVRPGDYIEFFSEIDIIAGLSLCPGGVCSEKHSSDKANCYPLRIEVDSCIEKELENWESSEFLTYNGEHKL